jgi:hypothetical protein
MKDPNQFSPFIVPLSYHGSRLMEGKVNTLNLITSNGNILQDGLELTGAKKENEPEHS